MYYVILYSILAGSIILACGLFFLPKPTIKSPSIEFLQSISHPTQATDLSVGYNIAYLYNGNIIELHSEKINVLELEHDQVIVGQNVVAILNDGQVYFYHPDLTPWTHSEIKADHLILQPHKAIIATDVISSYTLWSPVPVATNLNIQVQTNTIASSDNEIYVVNNGIQVYNGHKCWMYQYNINQQPVQNIEVSPDGLVLTSQFNQVIDLYCRQTVNDRFKFWQQFTGEEHQITDSQLWIKEGTRLQTYDRCVPISFQIGSFISVDQPFKFGITERRLFLLVANELKIINI